MATLEDEEPVGPRFTRRHVLKIGAVAGGVAFVAPALSIVTANPALAGPETSSQVPKPPGSCHPSHPPLYVICNWRGNTIGLQCSTGSDAFAPFGTTNVNQSLRNTFEQHGCWSSRWGTYTSGGNGNENNGNENNANENNANGFDQAHGVRRNQQPQSFFSPAGYGDCHDLGSSSFHLDPACRQPIWWRPPSGCQNVQFFCQKSMTGRLTTNAVTGDTAVAGFTQLLPNASGWYDFT